MCERLPPTGCSITEAWDIHCYRRMIRYLVGECQWTYEEITTKVEPFVARHLSPYFWNRCCQPRDRLISPPSIYRSLIEYLLRPDNNQFLLFTPFAKHFASFAKHLLSLAKHFDNTSQIRLQWIINIATLDDH